MRRELSLRNFQRLKTVPERTIRNATVLPTDHASVYEPHMNQLILAAFLFLAIHLFVSGTSLRDRLVAGIGEKGFQGVFSIASLLLLIWMIRAYASAPMIAVWGPNHWFRPIAMLTMIVAFELVVIGLTTPSPTAAGGEGQLDADEPATGILRVTRHPFLWGVLIWSATHLVVNGDAASIVFFGTFALLSISGPLSIDAKRRRRFGAKWRRFEDITSNVPFAAIVSGRNSLRLAEIGWWRPVAGFVAFTVLLLSHQWLFGVSPHPV